MDIERLSNFFDGETARATGVAAAFLLLIGVAALVSGSSGFLGRTLGAAFLPDQQGKVASTGSLSDEARTSQKDGALGAMGALPKEQIDSNTLWLARCIYSETKRAEEQELVAWVVRNRVETRYRGNDSYREAVLDPYQFSAFNPGSRKRADLLSLDASSQASGWQRALLIAHHVKQAPIAERPFSEDTRHFFSERSMAGGRHPNWSADGSKVKPERHEIAEDRFRFYEDVR